MHEKGKENWIGEQCSESEENLKKNNSRRAYQLVKPDYSEITKELLPSKTAQENASQKNEKYKTRLTKYWSELHNHETNGGPLILNCPQIDTEDDYSILRKNKQTNKQKNKNKNKKWRLQ